LTVRDVADKTGTPLAEYLDAFLDMAPPGNLPHPPPTLQLPVEEDLLP